ncbi:MAG: EthD family reductase [Betaproteobacteria bacterium]|nr:EthD family reductase [Betaproteobacteria bacterium]
MAKLIALYKTPADKAAFDAYYFGKHVPLAKTIAGLKRYEVNEGAVAGLQGDPGIHLAAILSFDSMAALQQALSSPQGQAAAADLANFAQAGVDLLIFDSKDV